MAVPNARCNNICKYPSFPKIGTKTMVQLLIVTLLLGVSHSSNGPDVEREALLFLLRALKDTNKSITDWNPNLVSPCFSWSYVTCQNGHVVALSLASKGFSGTLSPYITKLKYLTNLELQDNDLSGPLPDYVGSLINLQNLNFARNKLDGSIPNSWGQLSNLKNLDLSFNDLSGKIPPRLFSVPTYDFRRTHMVCNLSSHQPCFASPSFPVSTKKSKAVTAFMIAGGCFTLLLLMAALFVYRHQRLQKSRLEIFVDVAGEDDRKYSFGQVRRFSWREIQLATENFSEKNIIGSGGSGKVYKGVFVDGTKVALKRLTGYNSIGGEVPFLREVELISVAVHKNLLRLIGFCTTSTERILVYPFMQNLSVGYRLRELKPGEKGLDWPRRKKVALGTANGLQYMHGHCNPKIIHRDLKAANILLDENFEAVLGDFGLAKLVDAKLTHVTTQVRGTMGHIAPEYLSTGKSSEKTDVFGYGITLLELVTGQRAIDLSRLEEEDDVLLLDHMKKLLKEKRLHDIVDTNLKVYDERQVEMMVQVALLCTQNRPEDRPRMAEVVNMLGGVGLEERWEDWGRTEEQRNQEFVVSMMAHHRFAWGEESLDDEEPLHLSDAR